MTAPALAPPKRRSYSQLSTYLECPELYRHKYVDKVPEDPAIWSIGGTAFHSVAEQYLRGDLGVEPTYHQLWTTWEEAFADAAQEVRAKNPAAPEDLTLWRAANRGSENLGWWKANGFQWVQDFISWRRTKGASLQPLTDDQGPMLERQFTVELGGVEVIVIPDAVMVDEHGQVDILDYKSSRDQRGPGGSLQLGVYKAGLLVATGIEATWGLYYMTRTASLLPRDLQQWSVELIGQMFADFDMKVRLGDFTPTPGDACKFCPFKKPATETRPQCSYYQKENA